MKKTFFIYLFFTFVLASCYKVLPEPSNLQLPDLTTTGANTLGCIANNSLWINGGNSKGAYSSIIKNEVYALFYLYKNKDNAILDIYGQMTYVNTNQKLQIVTYDKDLLKLGTFPISKASFEDFLLNKKYDLIDSLNPPTIKIIKLDTINKIASGTFEGVIYTKGKQEKMNIVDGRFDVKLR